MRSGQCSRRLAISSFGLASLATIFRTQVAAAQGSSPITQPSQKTKTGYLARANELREQAVREGDQAYGAVIVRAGLIVGEGRNYVVLQTDPTAHAELLAVRDAARRLRTADLSDCEVYSPATPCPMCQAALYWARVRRYHNQNTPPEGVAPKLSC